MTTLSGQPLAVTVTPANLHDLRQLMNLLFVKFPRVGGKVGRPPELPKSVTADKGYDCSAARDILTACGITPHIPRRGDQNDTPLGRARWPVERTISWLKQFRRLRIRWDRLPENTQAFLDLACAIINWRQRHKNLVLS